MRLRYHQDRLKGPALFISRCDSPETITIKPDGLEKDENNEIYAHEGSFIDKDGKVITLTKGTGLEFSADPIGILTEAVNLTDGEQAGSLMRRGVIYADKIPYPEGVEYDDSFKASIEAKLPHILCYGSNTPVAAGAGGGSSISFPITVAQGGTGATDAETARTNLEIDSKTNTDATKATAEAAKATAEQNKADITDLKGRVTTLEG